VAGVGQAIPRVEVGRPESIPPQKVYFLSQSGQAPDQPMNVIGDLGR
jgi:hypothetical protein